MGLCRGRCLRSFWDLLAKNSREKGERGKEGEKKNVRRERYTGSATSTAESFILQCPQTVLRSVFHAISSAVCSSIYSLRNLSRVARTAAWRIGRGRPERNGVGDRSIRAGEVECYEGLVFAAINLYTETINICLSLILVFGRRNKPYSNRRNQNSSTSRRIQHMYKHLCLSSHYLHLRCNLSPWTRCRTCMLQIQCLPHSQKFQ